MIKRHYFLNDIHTQGSYLEKKIIKSIPLTRKQDKLQMAKYLNVKTENHKIFRKKNGRNLCTILAGGTLLSKGCQPEVMEENTSQFDYTKTNSCVAKTFTSKLKRLYGGEK
jgi:hypothetical protein